MCIGISSVVGYDYRTAYWEARYSGDALSDKSNMLVNDLDIKLDIDGVRDPLIATVHSREEADSLVMFLNKLKSTTKKDM